MNKVMIKTSQEYSNGRVRSSFDFDQLEWDMFCELAEGVGLSKNKFIRQLIKEMYELIKADNSRCED